MKHLLKPKKSLGQNFLTNHHVKEKIIQACQLHQEDTVLEIGPGKGALTAFLVNETKKVYAVEKDRSLCTYLEETIKTKNLRIINADILKFDFKTLPAGIKLIGNLPYYISTPIIEKLIENRHHLSRCLIMVQWEFGKRLTAQPNSKDFGSLSCFIQFYADPKILFKIKNTCFHPSPKVDSCMLELNFIKKPKFSVVNEQKLFFLIQKTFTQRRKTVLNALTTQFTKENAFRILNLANINPALRPENLSLGDYVRIANLSER